MESTSHNPLDGFSREELRRYDRHLILPGIGPEGQRKLKHARVLIVGAGGLGCPSMLYLAAAGVGTIGIIDFDTVDESNLQRQVLFGTDDVGKSKAEVAKKKLLALNPHIQIETFNYRLTSDNALELFRRFHIVADGADNFATRYLVNDAAVLAGIPNVYASIFRFDGQVSVFNQLQQDGSRGPNYRDIYPTPPPPGEVPSCAEGGVLGVLPGIIGSMQACEVIKVITGAGETLSGRFLVLDALTFTVRVLNIRKDPSNPLTGDNPTLKGLIDYDEFCGSGVAETPKVEGMQLGLGTLGGGMRTKDEITVQELQAWKEEGRIFQLIDVREPYEAEIAAIGGVLIPLAEIDLRKADIRTDIPVVVHCRSGQRSRKAIERLKAQGYTNLLNLKGGILAWAREVDDSVSVY